MSTYLSSFIENIQQKENLQPVPIMSKERTVLNKGKVSFIFKANGNIALNGFSNQYEIHYPNELQSFNVSEKDLAQIIKKINKVATQYWPCMNCFYYGIGLSLFTCCISYIIPHMCISDSENFVKDELVIFNKSYFNPRGLEIVLIKKCFSSWLQINILTYDDIHQSSKVDKKGSQTIQPNNNNKQVPYVSYTEQISTNDIETDQSHISKQSL